MHCIWPVNGLDTSLSGHKLRSLPCLAMASCPSGGSSPCSHSSIAGDSNLYSVLHPGTLSSSQMVLSTDTENSPFMHAISSCASLIPLNTFLKYLMKQILHQCITILLGHCKVFYYFLLFCYYFLFFRVCVCVCVCVCVRACVCVCVCNTHLYACKWSCDTVSTLLQQEFG